MTRNRLSCWSSAVLTALLMLVPVSASAQLAGGIAGEVTDDTGGVLPGVTVEAASEALIEGSRVVVTDGQGRYNVINLGAGTYTVTFTLPGFSTAIREDVVLTAGFTATINTEMSVGALQETITVSGASPLVDVQNVAQQQSLTTELLETLPTGLKAVASSLITLVPGVTGTADVGGSSGLYRSNGQSGALFFHGKSDSEMLYDGMGIADPNGASIIFMVNTGFASETVMETGSGNAESKATIVMTLIPEAGGNQFAGLFDVRYSDDTLQANNLDQGLIDQGVTFTNEMLLFYNVDGTFGGPIARDKVWFHMASRAARTKNTVPGVWFNDGIGRADFKYIPDKSRKAYRSEWVKSLGGRVTWQATERNKFGFFGDFQSFFNRGRGEFYSPEAFGHQYNLSPQQLFQVTYTSTLSSRLLFEAGFSHMRGRWPYPSPGADEFASVPGAIHTRELNTGFRWNARSYYSDRIKKHRWSERASLSYVTGSHNFKAGFQLEHGISEFQREVQGDVEYRFRNGLPSRIIQQATYADDPKKEHMTPLGIFIQDQWALRRLSLNLGLRFDIYGGRVPAQSFRATPFIPAREFAEIGDAIAFTDVNPRFGVAYDLFGTGQTAVKFALGRYVESTLSGLVSRINPISSTVSSAQRTWNDDNSNFVPDCDLANFSQNGECGPISDLNFGQNRVGATTYDPAITHGFGNRNHTWDLSAEVVQQLIPGMSLTTGYYRNWAGNWRVNDNVLVTRDDFDPYCVTAPLDSRLPGGGGFEVCGLYDVSPAKYGQRLTVVKDAEQFIGGVSGVTCGEQRTSSGRAPAAGKNCGTSDFFSVIIDTRFANGAQLGGGFDTGVTRINTCFVIDSPQILLNCDTKVPFSAHHNFKMYGSFPLPYGLFLSGSFRSVAGRPIDANWRVPNNVIAPSLGRNLSACGTRTVCTSSVSVPLLAPYTKFLDRRNMLDLRFSKTVNTGGVRLTGNFDVYNLFNGNQVLGVNERFGSRWLVPAALQNNEVDSILAGRLIHLGATLEF